MQDFYAKPARLRIYLEICHQVDAPLPHAVKIKVIQGEKEIIPLSDDRSAFFPATDPYTREPNPGEKATREFDPAKFESSTLKILIRTPDGQGARTEFDLQSLR